MERGRVVEWGNYGFIHCFNLGTCPACVGHVGFCPMLDKPFANWWLARVQPFRDVPPEKLSAEREAMARQQDYNQNYAEFLKDAVFPAVDSLVQMLSKTGMVHRV